jgi:signal transduction histidine kinase
MAAIPIVSAGQVLAAIGLSFAEPQPFDPEARALVDSVAHQSALALERVRLLEAERTARTQAEAARGRLAFLAEASATLGSSLDYQATMRQLAGLLTPRLADWATIHLVTPAGRVELLELVHGDPAEADLAARLDAYYRAIPLPATVGSVLATGEAVVVPEITPEMLAAGGHDPEHLELLMGIGMTSAMVVPLAAHDEALGAITLVRAGSSPPYSAEDLAFVTDLASRAAVAIANARHFLAEEAARREAEAATRRTVRLQAITAALSGALTQDAVVTLLIEQGSAALGARGGTVAVADGPDGFRIVQSTDFPDDVIARWRRFTADAGIAIAEAIRTGEPVLLPTEAAIEGRFPHLAANRARVGYRAYAAIPLLADRRAVGAIGLTFAEPRAFAAEDVALMLALARQSAQALERARLYEAERAARDQAEAAERRGRREAARLVALANLSRAFVEAEPDYATAVDAVARITADHTGDCCVLRLVSDDGHWADVVALHHPDPAMEARFREIATPRQTADEGFSGIVLESGAPLLVPDVAAAPAAPRFPPDYGRHLAEIGLRGMLVVPLRARGRHLGTLALLRDRPQPPLTADDANFTQELADRAALAIDNARLYQEARAAIRARDEFLSVAAHELRTPVTTVKGYAQMLLRSQKRAISPERTLQFLSAIDDATDRLKQLAEDLLDVSRLRLGQLPLRRRETDLVALAAAVVERFSAQLDDHHSVRLHVAEAPAAVWADPDRVDQILSNLIDNAAKYSPAGGEIAVGVGPDGDGVRLTVRDRGIGLPPGEAETIFEPFNRATNAARENLPGLGLGLSICRSLAERHGGRIWAESAGEGEGTTFVLWLPRKEPGDEVIGS